MGWGWVGERYRCSGTGFVPADRSRCPRGRTGMPLARSGSSRIPPGPARIPVASRGSRTRVSRVRDVVPTPFGVRRHALAPGSSRILRLPEIAVRVVMIGQPYRKEKKKKDRSCRWGRSFALLSFTHLRYFHTFCFFFFFLLVRHRAPTLLGLFRHSHAHSHSHTYTHTFSLFLPVHSLLLSLSFSPCRSRSLPLARSCRLATNSCTCPGGLLERRCLSSSRF